MASRRQQIALLFLLAVFHSCLAGNAKAPNTNEAIFIKEVTEEHNKYRSNVNPSARNMRYMSWDNHLALTSQGWAKKCIDSESIDTETMPGMADPNFSNIGQNIWIGNYTSIGEIVKAWGTEGQQYVYAEDQCNSDQCDHYKKVVWADSYKIGCGAAACDTIQYYNRGTDLVLVACFYAPSAKASEQKIKPYLEGKSCSKCPAEYKCDRNLCRNDLIDSKEGVQKPKGSTSNSRWASYGRTAFIHLPYYSAIFSLIYCVT